MQIKGVCIGLSNGISGKRVLLPLWLTLSPPRKALHFAILLKPTIFNFWHSVALALRTERQSARMSKIKNGGSDQYGTEPFEPQQFGTAGVEGV